MNKKLIFIFVLIFSFMGFELNQTANASNRYQVVKVGKPSISECYPTQANKNIYMWNRSHTKIIDNLKNHPKDTWTVLSSVLLQSGKKKAVYYHIAKDTEAGYVWRGYLSKGHNPRYIYNYTEDSDVDTLYSSIPKNEWKNVSGPETNYTHKKFGSGSYLPFAKKPTSNQIKTVVNFINKTNEEDGITGTGKLTDGEYNGWQNYRIVMRPVSSENSKVMIPFVEYMQGIDQDYGSYMTQEGSEWTPAGTFKAFYDAAMAQSIKKLDPNKSINSQNIGIFTLASYELPSYSLVKPFSIYSANRIFKLSKGSLNLVQSNNQLYYLKSANVFDFSNGNKPLYLPHPYNGSYGTIDPAIDRNKMSVSDINKGAYRQIKNNYGSVSFTEFLREGLADKDYIWYENWGVAFNNADPINVDGFYDRDHVDEPNVFKYNQIPPYPLNIYDRNINENMIKGLDSGYGVWWRYVNAKYK